MSWTLQPENIEKWHASARNMAVQQGTLRREGRVDDIYEDTPYMTLFAQFLDAMGPFENWETGKAALFDWGEWLSGSEIKPRSEGQIYHATITKIYGGVHVTFGYQAVFDVPQNQAQGAYIYCLSMVNRQFKEFEKNGLAQMRPPQTSSGNTQDASIPGTATFVGDKLVVEDKGDGQLYYKIKGAQYGKFGVRVWPEVLAQADIEVSHLSAGSYPFERECVVEIVNGKARKVIEIA